MTDPVIVAFVVIGVVSLFFFLGLLLGSGE